MYSTPFHAYLAARWLGGFANSEALIPVYASSSIGVYPYQIAAARFAMRSRYIKGCILCDEGSLGKTYEALLVAAQRWYEGKDRLLLVLPVNLVNQWVAKIESGFALPYTIWNSENGGESLPECDGIIITTYDFAVRQAEIVASRTWDMVIFDEADVLFKPENKIVKALKAATNGAFKLLLTPTPITMSVMDIYGLIHFIDETVLPEADVFYKRYFRKPENYPELTSWVSQFAFRTLKSQVTAYVNFTERLPVTIDYALTAAEKGLYTKIEAYLALPKKAAYPSMDNYELTLMYYHILSSSPKAFCKTLEQAISRLDECGEKAQLVEIQSIAGDINESGKMKALFEALKLCFGMMKRLKYSPKAILFTNNLTTLGILAELLKRQGYPTITSTTPDYIERFRNEGSAVLIATDTTAKGLDMEFCPVIINYDLLYNAVEMEQRISRCHRQGQTADVVVVNLLSKENISDVRILELINKRTLQFDGIFGMSDAVVGNFDVPLEDILCQARKPKKIQQAFETNIATHENTNKPLISNAEDTLFTTFTKSIADKVKVTPQYISDMSMNINDELWELVKHFFAQHDDYEIDEQNMTATFTAEGAPHLFYYWSGKQSRPYNGMKKYGMGQSFKPHHGRITLTSILARGIIGETACADNGSIVVDADIEPCEIALYEVSITTGKTWLADYDVLVGITESGDILSDEQCRTILEMPVLSYEEDGEPKANWLRGVTDNSTRHQLDYHVLTDKLIERYMSENNTEQAEEIERIKLRALRKKTTMEHLLGDLKGKIKTAKQDLTANAHDRMKEMVVNKGLKEREKQLRDMEQNLYFEQMRVDVAAEEEIEAISSTTKYTASAKRHFIISITGTGAASK
jgi:hypothetical protein